MHLLIKKYIFFITNGLRSQITAQKSTKILKQYEPQKI